MKYLDKIDIWVCMDCGHEEDDQNMSIAQCCPYSDDKEECKYVNPKSEIISDYLIKKKENEELKLINKKLQCCGNCKKYRMLESQIPLSCLKNRKAYSCCEDWEMDE